MTVRRRMAPGVRSAAAIALAALTLVGCGAEDGSVEKANDELRSTSFHSSGTTTAFNDGTQEAWWDPDEGFRLKASWTGGSGEMFCKDGKTYTHATLLAKGLKEKGQSITVPDELAAVFVTSETDGGCETYFQIPKAAEHAPEEDRTSQGKLTRAFSVSVGTARDTYYIESDTSRLVQLVSGRNGVFSTTEYDSFGEKFSITLPSDADTMSMDEFRRQAT
ncbi:hypothetical protein ACF09C_15710 [Streptomyces sp. NPDC014870]|uniref:hypothetical protein n=1 Tax=Streptomyces sp. NPDC014870 TaxID=3364925 RepID=UPI0036FC67DA